MKVVIFGGGKFASLAWYCLTHDSNYEVAGFTVDREYLIESVAHGLPVVDFTEVERIFPPSDHLILVHVGPASMNAVRTARCAEARHKGYGFASYASSRAFTWPDFELRANSVIYEGAIIQPFAHIGENVIVRSGAHISHHVSIGDHCFIAAGACLGGGVVVEPRCFIGLNATIRDGIRIAEGCLIAAGAMIAADTEPDGLYMGVPGKRAPTPASQLSKV